MENPKSKLPETTDTADKGNSAEISLEDLEELLHLDDKSISLVFGDQKSFKPTLT